MVNHHPSVSKTGLGFVPVHHAPMLSFPHDALLYEVCESSDRMFSGMDGTPNVFGQRSGVKPEGLMR